MSTTPRPSWLESRLPLCGVVRAAFLDRPIGRDFSYGATLAALTAFTLALLALSGFVLALTYVPIEGGAFASIQDTIRGVNYGWLIHAIHRTGTTMLFALFYLRILGRLRRSAFAAPGEMVWWLGLGEFALLLLVGWIGFTLADGALSYWSLRGAVAGAGAMGGLPGALGAWFFGGAAIDIHTLPRMAIFHYALAFGAIGIGVLHLVGRRAAALPASRNTLAFHPFGTAKTFVALVVFALVFAILVFFHPNLDQPAANFLRPSLLSVPVAVVAPWYLAPFAAMADCAPGALGPVLIVLAAFAALAGLPWLHRGAAGALYPIAVWVLALDVLGLGIVGGAGHSAVSGVLGLVFTIWYFFHFLVLTPALTARAPATIRTA